MHLRILVAIISGSLLLFSGCGAAPPAARSGTAPAFPGAALVDLTHDFSEETIYWVTAKPFKLETVFEGRTENGFYYSAYNYSGAEHGGTHIDAPVHFAEGRNSVDSIELERLIAPAVKIDVSAKAIGNANYLVSVQDISEWESAHGPIPDGSILLLQTGYASFWGDAARYLGTDERGESAAAKLRFPGLDPEAARWITKNRKIGAVGIDTASIDSGKSATFDSHVILMKENIPAFENVANLDKLPFKDFYVIALPMKIKGGSGAPLRIVAVVP